MSSMKTIKVNPIFLMGSGGSGGGGGSGTSKNKTRKEKPLAVSLGQSNNIKKKLIARIKNFQQNAVSTNDVKTDDTFTSEFSESVQFLDNLARDKQETKANKRNATLKKKQPHNPAAYMQIATELPPELMGGNPPHPPFVGSIVNPVPPFVGTVTTLPASATTLPASGGVGGIPPVGTPNWSAPPPPSYSNLKTGGTKPTYRTWLRNTQKNKHVSTVPTKPPINILEDMGQSISIDTVPAAIPVQTIQTVLAQTAAALSVPLPTAETTTAETTTAEPIITPSPALQTEPQKGGSRGAPPKPKRSKITRTLKYKLGKHANGKVSVLIKNSNTRRKVQTEHAKLKQKSILDIKNHLRSKNLLKVGSEAPNDVLRHIYEQSILAGQIENKAKDTLIHNYFNEEK